MMDHLDARERLDIAAAEPGGLDRLMAGDTPDAIALAGHLAGCPECTDEFGRLQRSAAVLRDVIRTQPRPELRAQTLAFVAAVGRPRGAAAVRPESVTAAGTAPAAGSVTAISGVPAADAAPVVDAAPVAAIAPVATASISPQPATAVPDTSQRLAPLRPAGDAPTTQATTVLPAPIPLAGRRTGRARLAWLAVAAALVVATAGATGFAVSSLKDTAARQASQQLEGLTEVASWTVRLDAQPDVQRVVLAVPGEGSPAGATQVGTLVFSPGTQQIVVVADGLAAPPPGAEYRCWVEIAGTRERLGRMYLAGDVAYWVGDAAALAKVTPGSVFGVSLADPANPAGAAVPLLSGTLQTT